ncbi:MAG TPA: endopeptidase La [Acidobacteriota bacterium]|jgi:ATP-dependent Lon protease|nr:endopeptidase La [Acidobacteriota bacterium]
MTVKSEEPKTQNEAEIPIPSQLPVLAMRDMVTFPFMIVPVFIGREPFVKAVDSALSQHRMVLLLAQRDPAVDEPTAETLYSVGTVGIILRMLKMPDQKQRVLIQGLQRARVRNFVEGAPHPIAEIETLNEPTTELTIEVEATIRSVRAALEKVAALGKNISPEIAIVANNTDDPGRLADLAASNLEMKVEEAQDLLETLDPLGRLRRVNEILAREVELLSMQQKISEQAKDEIEKTQKEYFLRQQMKAIQQELGEAGEMASEITALKKKAEEVGLPQEAKEEVDRQISRLEAMHPDSAETGMVRTYIDWMLALPWAGTTEDQLDLSEAQKILDEDHYDLEKVKTRIIEYLAVLKLTQNMRGPILCFVGPPGVGKTSLGRSIARALGRKFVRISLGGLHDEAEVRGHRRTYIGAMPGRIIQGLRNAGSNNPVFMLDEVDKVGMDFRGDPSSALLEVLDPEQNNAFRDNYLGVPFDLSRVLFITTANLPDPIQPALRDRMEVIQLTGYTENEKLHIAKRYLIPKQVAAHGIGSEDVEFQDDAVLTVINRYTREAGLRNLERELATICRKVARQKAEGRAEPVAVTPDRVHRYLGPERILPEELLQEDRIGVAVGLAWTPAGGDILFIEAIAMKGRGELILTGQLGDVMKESARAAMSYARARAVQFKIPEDFFEKHDIHIHVPAGAIPKDGPSAGVTLAAALVSVCSRRPVRRNVAMTGEITLRGRVAPIGGLKEKVLAARQAKIYEVILPEANRKDLEDISKDVLEEMKFVFVEEIDQVVNTVLVAEKLVPSK